MKSYSVRTIIKKIRYYQKNGLITKKQSLSLISVANRGDAHAADIELQKLMGRVHV